MMETFQKHLPFSLITIPLLSLTCFQSLFNLAKFYAGKFRNHNAERPIHIYTLFYNITKLQKKNPAKKRKKHSFYLSRMINSLAQ